jgi:hypothetical protein
MIEAITFVVTFGEHISRDRMRDMVSSLAAAGNVLHGSPDREYLVDVIHPAHLPSLREKLLQWDLHGFVRWSERKAPRAES